MTVEIKTRGSELEEFTARGSSSGKGKLYENMSLSKAQRLYEVQQFVSCSFPGKHTNLFGSRRPLSCLLKAPPELLSAAADSMEVYRLGSVAKMKSGRIEIRSFSLSISELKDSLFKKELLPSVH